MGKKDEERTDHGAGNAATSARHKPLCQNTSVQVRALIHDRAHFERVAR